MKRKTGLLTAAGQGQLETVQWLLSEEGGASITERDSGGYTALLRAAQQGRLETVQWLLSEEGGASITERTNNGFTALLTAAFNGHLETVQWLLSEEGGASITERCNNGFTALLIAAQEGQLETVQWLLSEEGGASITERTNNGYTALLTAAGQGQLETVQWLLSEEGGASIMEKNNDNNTCIQVSSGKTLEWLKKHEARLKLLTLGSVPPTSPRLYVCGPVASGKTTLCRQLAAGVFGGFVSSVFRRTPSPNEPRNKAECTAGVDIQQVLLDGAGTQVTLFDFAGHSEYYITHEMVVEAKGGLFVVLINLHDPPEKRAADLDFWLNFICGVLSHTDDAADKPSVVIVFSHADSPHSVGEVEKVKGVQECRWAKQAIASCVDRFKSRLDIDPEPVLTNCTSYFCKEQKQLRKKLAALRLAAIEKADRVPATIQMVQDHLPGLRKQHSSWPVLPTEEFCTWLEDFVPVLASPKWFRTAMQFLESIGELFYFPNSDQVFISPQFLCGNVIAKVLAPHTFLNVPFQGDEGKQKRDTGLVSAADLEEFFGARSQQVLAVLVDLGIAFFVEAGSADQSVVMIPSLLHRQRPDLRDHRTKDIWHPCAAGGSPTVLGRRLLCTPDSGALSTGFFPRLQVAVRNRFASNPDLWTGGFQFCEDQNGVNIVGQLSMSGRGVDLWVHSLPERAADSNASHNCLAALDSMFRLALEIRDSVCPGVELLELALSVRNLSKRNPLPNDVHGYDLSVLRDHALDNLVRPTHPKTDAICEVVGTLVGKVATRLLVLRANSLHDQVRPVAVPTQAGKTAVVAISQSVGTDKEDKLIQKAARAAKTAAVVIESIGDVTRADLKETLKRFQPHWVHYVGHGERDGKIVLVDPQGQLDHLPVTDFVEMVAETVQQGQLKGVVFNCCHSKPMAETVHRRLNVPAVGGEPTLPDTFGLEFAREFWKAAFAHKTVEESFEAGSACTGTGQLFQYSLSATTEMKQERLCGMVTPLLPQPEGAGETVVALAALPSVADEPSEA